MSVALETYTDLTIPYKIMYKKEPAQKRKYVNFRVP
jgi:hypothetical protein